MRRQITRARRDWRFAGGLGRLGSAPEQAKRQQRRGQPGIEDQFGRPGLLEHDEMHHRGGRGEVNQPMQPLPSGAAQPADHRRIRGDGQRHQQREGQHADGDVGALDDVGPDGAEIEALIKHAIDCQVQHRIVEGEETERAPPAQPIGEAEATQRGDGKREDQKTQRPDSQRTFQGFLRIGPQLIDDTQIKRPDRRQQAEEVDAAPHWIAPKHKTAQRRTGRARCRRHPSSWP